MTKTELYNVLDKVDHSRVKRQEMATLIAGDPGLFKPLLLIAFEDKNIISSRACWVMEFTAKENLTSVVPYLNTIAANLGFVKLDSSVRPLAKICEYLVKAYFSNIENDVQEALTDQHLKQITTACFDWLIGDHKVAAQAYSMTCLVLLGKKYDWIHPELKLILEQNYAKGSAAYKARARLSLAKIK